jgi:hypothetical protein
MRPEPFPDRLHATVRNQKFLRWFTVFTRIIIALAFLPSGLTKVLGHRFTKLGIDNPVGFFLKRSIAQVFTGASSAFVSLPRRSYW